MHYASHCTNAYYDTSVKWGGGGEKAPSFCEVLTQQYIKGLAADCNSGEWT